MGIGGITSGTGGSGRGSVGAVVVIETVGVYCEGVEIEIEGSGALGGTDDVREDWMTRGREVI